MRSTWILLFVIAAGHGSRASGDPERLTPPKIFQFDGARIADVQRRIGRGDEHLASVVKRLRDRADEALRSPPLSVVEKPQVPLSGDKHDYLSIAPYWWPDPDQPDGRPYVRKDGRTNPERNQYDRPRIGRLCEAVPDLALAYALTGHEPYAEHAGRWLRTWFLDPKTRMNPNLNFGQFVPGRNDGRGAGVIETRGLIRVVDAAGLLEGSNSWAGRDSEGMRVWFREYLAWMRESAIGKAESLAKNNHGSWYDAQVVTYALFVGDDRLAREILDEAKTRRISRQIEPDGRQTLELTRTKSFGYCVFNLDALTTLADLGGRMGVDLWSYRTADGRSIRKAVDWLLPYATGAKPWPYDQITTLNPAGLVGPLRRAANAYHDPSYERVIDQLAKGGGPPDELLILLHPSNLRANP